MARRYHGDKEDGTARRIEVWHRLSYSLPAVGLLMPTIGNVVHRASVGMFNFRSDYQPCFLEGLFECSAAPPLPNNGVDQQITFTDRGNNLDANVAQRRPNCPCCSGHHDFTPPDQPPYTTLPDEFFGEQSSHNGRTAYQPPPAKMPADGFKMEAVKLSIEKCGETSVTLKWRATKLDAESYFMEMTNSLEAFKTAHLVFNGPPPGLRSSGCYHYCVPGLVSGVDYRFRVKYSCILGESPQSPWISAKTQGTIPSKYTRRRKVTHPAVPDNNELAQKELKTKKLQKRAENRAKEKERRRQGKNKSKAKPPKLKKEKPAKPKKPEEKKEISEPPSETLVTNTKQVTLKQKQTPQEPAQTDAPKGKKKKRRKKKNQDWTKEKLEELKRYESILKEKNKQTTHDDVVEVPPPKPIPVVPQEVEESDDDDDDDNSENGDISGEEESSSSEDEDEQDNSDDSDSDGGSREAKSSSRQDDVLSTSSSSDSPDDTPLDVPQRLDTISVTGSIDEDNGKGRKRRPRRRKKKKDKRQQTPVQTTPPKKSSSHEARRPPIHRHHDRMDERNIPFTDGQTVHPYNSARYSTRQRIGNGDRKPMYAAARREEMFGGQRLPPNMNIHRPRQGPPERGYPPIIEQRRSVSDPLPPLSQNAPVFNPSTPHVATSFYDPLKQTVSPDLNYVRDVSSQHLTQPRPASTDTMGQPMYFNPMMQNRFLGEVITPPFNAPHIQPTPNTHPMHLPPTSVTAHVGADTPDFLPVGPHGPMTPFSPYADPYPEQPFYDFATSKASDELDQNAGVADTVSSNLGGRSNEPSSTQNRTPTTGSDSEPFSPLDRNDPSYFLPSGIIEPDDGKNATYQDDMDAPVDSELASASAYSGGSMWLQQPSESWGNLPPEYERADEKDLRPSQPSNSAPPDDDEAAQEDYPFRPSPSASDTPCEVGRLSPPPSLWWERQKNPAQDSE